VSASIMAVVGGVVLLFCVGVAIAALILFIISYGVAPSLAALLVSLALGIAAAAFVMRARSLVKNWSPVPIRTVQALREDFAALKKAVTHVST
jgi:Putative Actinobacterial Holin-X, holin superfamily III